MADCEQRVTQKKQKLIFIWNKDRHIPYLSFVASLLTEYKYIFDISLEKSESMELSISILEEF